MSAGFRIAAALAFAAALSVTGGAGAAQSGPAELPPPGYPGTQYVDSNGCAFLRAGVAGTVSWVPRLDQNRQPVCGLPPSVVAVAPVQVPVPAAVTEIAVVPVQPPAAAPPRQPVRQPAPQRVRLAPRPHPAPPQFIPAADPTARCPGNAVVAERLGPQGSWFELVCDHAVLPDPFDQRRKNNAGSGPGGVSHVAVPGSRVSNSAVLQHLPRGYRPVWEDGRLNPQRGFGTAQGAAQMALVWSNTVPQVLINAYTGKPATAIEAQALGLTLPYARRSHPAKHTHAPAAALRPSVASRAATPSPAQEPLRARATAPQPEQRPVSAPADGGLYVQVATFADEAAARHTVTQVQRMGFPARLGHFTRQGQRHQVVMAGPFTTEAQAQRARDTARGAGYRNATLR